MSFLKKIFKKDDEIPEMHLQKNEPKPYYSKEHECWLIPGKEKEMIEAIAKQKKEPPKKISSTSQKQPSISTSIRQKPAINRYAMIIPTDNITDTKPTENIPDIKTVNKDNTATSRNMSENSNQNQEFLERNDNMLRQLPGININLDYNHSFTHSHSFSHAEENIQTESNNIKLEVTFNLNILYNNSTKSLIKLINIVCT